MTATRGPASRTTHVTEYPQCVGPTRPHRNADGGVVRTWYDRLERVRFTQTAQDVLDGQYRYICYDRNHVPPDVWRGRAGRRGLDLHVDDVDWPADDPTDATDCAQCQERVTTVYGVPIGGASSRLTWG